ncbi:hypothetical protein BB559_003917 [Furculomyces boomerangus]|uniref:glucan endo-1,3-beta-D-glucosidase n=1 Tax=Furculomyces boomerangus TaxID=61424 RepID=A0A2T9YHZ3_9FUNG|nr:hypothetical protein BB559_003917 [Furculomyces boomerangus]
MVGETGWPTDGDDFGVSHPSIENSQKYMNNFVCRSAKEGLDYAWFQAMDTQWASTANASNVEAHWGILGSDYKTPKYPGDTWINCDNISSSSSSPSSSGSPNGSSSSGKPTGSSSSGTPTGSSSSGTPTGSSSSGGSSISGSTKSSSAKRSISSFGICGSIYSLLAKLF